MVSATAEQIRRDLCYELKWMLRAVVSFEQVKAAGDRDEAAPDSDLVALQDSALLHARNLVEFANASADPTEPQTQWALSDILGAHRRKVPTSLRTFLNRWVVQLGDGATHAKWPKDLAGDRIDDQDDARLSKITEAVFKALKPKHRTTTLETDEGVAYVELLDRAREYFEQRTPQAFAPDLRRNTDADLDLQEDQVTDEAQVCPSVSLDQSRPRSGSQTDWTVPNVSKAASP